MSEEVCQICGVVDVDQRYLRLQYFYRLEEVSPLFTSVEMDGRAFYEIQTCKDCRGEFLDFLQAMMSADEWRAYTGRTDEPVRLRPNIEERQLTEQATGGMIW